MEISDVRNLFGDETADMAAKSSLLVVLLKKLPPGWLVHPIEHGTHQDVVDHTDQFIGIRMGPPKQIVRSLADTTSRAIAGHTYSPLLNETLRTITDVHTGDAGLLQRERQRYVDCVTGVYKSERGEGVLNTLNVRHQLQMANIDIGLPEGDVGDLLNTFDRFLRDYGTDKYTTLRQRYVPKFGEIYCRSAMTNDNTPIGEFVAEMSARNFDSEHMRKQPVHQHAPNTASRKGAKLSPTP